MKRLFIVLLALLSLFAVRMRQQKHLSAESLRRRICSLATLRP